MLLLPDVAAARVWLLLEVLGLAAAAWLLCRTFRASPALVFALVALFAPVYLNLVDGQVNLVLLAILLGAHRAAEAQRPALAGALVVVGSLAKPLPLLLLPLWMLQRRWAASGWAIGLSALAAVLVLAAQTELAMAYVTILAQGATADAFPAAGFANHAAANTLAILGLALGAPTPPRGALFLIAAAVLLGLLVLRRVHLRRDPAAGLAAIGLLGVLLPVHGWEHYLVWALPAVTWWATRPGREPRVVGLAVLLLYLPYHALWLPAVLALARIHPLAAHALDELRALALITLLLAVTGVLRRRPGAYSESRARTSS